MKLNTDGVDDVTGEKRHPTYQKYSWKKNLKINYDVQNNLKKRCNLGIHNNSIPLIRNIILLFSLKSASTNHVDHFLGFLTIWIEIRDTFITCIGFIRLYNFPPSP